MVGHQPELLSTPGHGRRRVANEETGKMRGN